MSSPLFAFFAILLLLVVVVVVVELNEVELDETEVIATASARASLPPTKDAAWAALPWYGHGLSSPMPEPAPSLRGADFLLFDGAAADDDDDDDEAAE